MYDLAKGGDLVDEPLPVDVGRGRPLGASHHKDPGRVGQRNRAGTAADLGQCRLGRQFLDGFPDVHEAFQNRIHPEEFLPFALREGTVVGHPVGENSRWRKQQERHKIRERNW